MIWKCVDALANDGDVRMLLDGPRDLGGKGLTVDGKRRTRGDSVLIGRPDDQRVQSSHLLMQKANGVMLGIVTAEAVAADHFGKVVGFVCRRATAAAAHFAETDAQTSLGELPRRFGAGEAAADDVDVEAFHAAAR
jgi:hypothetical protein